MRTIQKSGVNQMVIMKKDQHVGGTIQVVQMGDRRFRVRRWVSWDHTLAGATSGRWEILPVPPDAMRCSSHEELARRTLEYVAACQDQELKSTTITRVVSTWSQDDLLTDGQDARRSGGNS